MLWIRIVRDVIHLMNNARFEGGNTLIFSAGQRFYGHNICVYGHNTCVYCVYLLCIYKDPHKVYI